MKKLNDDNTHTTAASNITTNQIAHQRLMNGNTKERVKHKTISQKYQPSGVDHFKDPSTQIEVINAIKAVKNRKAAGIGSDGMYTEQIQHFSRETTTWLVKMFNNCIDSIRMANMNKKAHIIALLKPEKNANDVKKL